MFMQRFDSQVKKYKNKSDTYDNRLMAQVDLFCLFTHSFKCEKPNILFLIFTLNEYLSGSLQSTVV